MLWFFIGHIFSILLSLFRVSRLSENDKDLEIIILRHQLDVMVRKQNKPIRPNRAEKATLALLTAYRAKTSIAVDYSTENRSMMSLSNTLIQSYFISFGAGSFYGLVHHLPHIFNHFVIDSS
jgi:hypothetical protein